MSLHLGSSDGGRVSSGRGICGTSHRLYGLFHSIGGEAPAAPSRSPGCVPTPSQRRAWTGPRTRLLNFVDDSWSVIPPPALVNIPRRQCSRFRKNRRRRDLPSWQNVAKKGLSLRLRNRPPESCSQALTSRHDPSSLIPLLEKTNY